MGRTLESGFTPTIGLQFFTLLDDFKFVPFVEEQLLPILLFRPKVVQGPCKRELGWWWRRPTADGGLRSVVSEQLRGVHRVARGWTRDWREVGWRGRSGIIGSIRQRWSRDSTLGSRYTV